MTTRVSGRAPSISEKQIEEAVCAFLEIDGWRSVVTDPKHVRGLGVSEKGIPDRLFLRYGPTRNTPDDCIERAMYAQAMWVEFKAPGKLPRHDQVVWHQMERSVGGLVLVVDDFDRFRDWYLASGLARRVRKPSTARHDVEGKRSVSFGEVGG